MEVTTFCRICNAMCGLIVTVEDEQVVKIRGDESHALSRGYTCPKGRALGALHHAEDRLDQPLMRRGESMETVEWDAALRDIATRVRSSSTERGADTIAMYLASGSAFDTAGRRTAERFLSRIGSRQKYTATTIDTPSKPLVAELVGGWSGLTPIWDHETSKILILFGSNPVVSHGHSNAMPDPVRRLREFKDRGGEIWVLDPRRTETANLATRHLQLRPGADWLVLGWLVRRLLVDHPSAASLTERATGVPELIAAVAHFEDAFVASACDLPLSDLEDLLSSILRVGRVSALTGTGVSMSASANSAEHLLWALHVVTDSYDAPGGMWFNPGYLMQLDTRAIPISDGTPESGPASRPSLPRRFGEYPCSALIPEIESGNITTLFVVGGNPITALPDAARTRRALASLETLIVIDIFPTETSELATHVLPAVDQLERADLTWLLDSYQLAVAAQRTDAVVAPIGGRRPVWRMFHSLAAELEIDLVPFASSTDASAEDALLAQVIDRSRSPIDLHSTTSLVVDSGAVFGWVTDRVLEERRWRIAPKPLLDQLTSMVEVERDRKRPSVVLLPTRRLRAMNSRFFESESPERDEADRSIHAAPSMVVALGSPQQATLTTTIGSVTAPLTADPSLRDDSITLTHGQGDNNVCALTSTDEGVDVLSGMVLQSGFEVSLRPAD